MSDTTLRLGRLLYKSAAAAGPYATLKQSSATGDQITLAVLLEEAQLADLIGWRNLAGNVDEPVVPFTSSKRPDLDGWYYVDSAAVETAGDFSGGAVEVTAQLRPVPAWNRPTVDISSVCAMRDQDLALPAQVWGGALVVPQVGADDRTWVIGSGLSAVSSVTGDQVQGSMFRFSVGAPAALTTRHLAPLPSQWYDLAPSLTVDGRPVVGRLPAWPAGVEDDDSWVLSNGIIRITPGTSGTDLDRLQIAGYTSGAWQTPRPFSLNVYDGGTVAAWFIPVAVLHNSPLQVTVRLARPGTSSVYFVDVTLRRGMRFVEITTSAAIDDVGPASADAGTDVATADPVTVGLAASSPTNGLTWVMSSGRVFTTDNVNGRLEFTSGAQCREVAVGYTDNAADTHDGSVAICTQHLYPLGARQTVVAA